MQELDLCTAVHKKHTVNSKLQCSFILSTSFYKMPCTWKTQYWPLCFFVHLLHVFFWLAWYKYRKLHDLEYNSRLIQDWVILKVLKIARAFRRVQFEKFQNHEYLLFTHCMRRSCDLLFIMSFPWKLNRYSYGVQFGINRTALNQSKLSNFAECTIKV